MLSLRLYAKIPNHFSMLIIWWSLKNDMIRAYTLKLQWLKNDFAKYCLWGLDSEEEVVADVVICISEKQNQERKNEKNGITWVDPWLTRRHELSFYETLMRQFFAEENIWKYKIFPNASEFVRWISTNN